VLPECSVVLGGGQGLLGDEDTIEEFTLVLGADLADLRDLGAGEGDHGVVEAVENELVLDVLGGVDGATGLEMDEVTLLSTKEVLDLNLLLVLGDVGVNGEMCVHESHLVAEALN